MKTNLLGGLLIASTLGMTPMMASADSGTLMSDSELATVIAGNRGAELDLYPFEGGADYVYVYSEIGRAHV